MSFINFFLPSRYTMRQYARRKVIGCIGGIIGAPLLCLFFVSLPSLYNALQSADQSFVPWILVGMGVAGCGVMLVVVLGAVALLALRRSS